MSEEYLRGCADGLRKALAAAVEANSSAAAAGIDCNGRIDSIFETISELIHEF